MSDRHHCRCFIIHEAYWDLLRVNLESYGFKDGLQIPAGQIYGLIKKISHNEQIHVKLMPSGTIEAEIEPSQDYPLAHIDSRYSYSAHNQVRQLLRQFGITPTMNQAAPVSCISPIIEQPYRPIHISGVAVFLAILLLIKN